MTEGQVAAFTFFRRNERSDDVYELAGSGWAVRMVIRCTLGKVETFIEIAGIERKARDWLRSNRREPAMQVNAPSPNDGEDE